MPRPIVLGCLVRAHARPLTLSIVLSEIRRYAALDPSQLTVRSIILLDRPTSEVELETDSAVREAPTLFRRLNCPFPLLDSKGEHFLRAKNFHLDALELDGPVDWVYILDDDFWAEPTQMYKRLIPNLQRPDVDVYFFENLFFHECSNTYRADRAHYTAFLWRHVMGARLSGRRQLKVPDHLYDNAVMRDRAKPFGVPHLDYGTFSMTDREVVVKRYFAAGKTDPFITSLLDPPQLAVFPTQQDPTYGPWTDRLQEALEARQTTYAQTHA